MGSKMFRWGLISVVFLIIITVLRLLWNDYLTMFDYQEKKLAYQGVLDLHDIKFTNTQTLPLNGEWEFYPSVFISPDEFGVNSDITHYEKIYLNTPDTWETAFTSEEKQPFRFGTYRLRIQLSTNDVHSFSLRINEIRNASTVYINNELVGSAGQATTNLSDHYAHIVPYTINTELATDEIEIVIHASNYSYAGNGGMTETIRFGTAEAINKRVSLSSALQLLLSVVFMMHIIYSLLLFFLGRKNKGLFYFSLLMICTFITVLVSDDRLLINWLNIPYEWSIVIIYFSYFGSALLLPLTIKHLFTINYYERVIRWFTYYCSFFALTVLIVPYSHIEGIIRPVFVSILLFSVISTIAILIKAINKTEEYIFLILATLSIGTTVVWPIITRPAVSEWMTYPFDFLFALFAFSAFWFQRFFKSTAKMKQLAEKLQIENEKKDEFLVNTSHELRNPLHVIMNMTHSILDDDTEMIHDTHRNRLEMMNSVSRRMSLILNDLIDITRLKEKTIQMKFAVVDIRTIVNGVIDMVYLMLEGKPVQLQVKIDNNFPALYADENRLIQILFNLVHNSVKYTDKGTITIRAEHYQDFAYIHVEDTGIGIEEAALQNIFQPYEQADVNEIKASGGFGLGLSICKQFVEMHGGTLNVKSTKGVGAVFTFSIPLFNKTIHSANVDIVPIIDEHKQAETLNQIENSYEDEAVATTDVNVKPKLLIVDDDSVNLTVLHNLLNTENYELIAMTSAIEALMSLDKTQYDLVIADVMMPDISGYELTRQIRKRYSISELPILLLTARSRIEDITAGFKVGANDYIKKPVDGTELKARVRALIDLKLSIEESLRMESAWLQSQIQPHFLFNTLNSIGALGTIDLAKMHSLLDRFSNYLRLSFDFKNTDPEVYIQHELDLVRSYLYIEHERFGDRLHIEWELEEELDDFKLPPLSIQPIVENAIRHGVLMRISGGTVWIQIKQLEKYYLIIIKDDGIGMSQEKLEHIFERKTESNKRQGIGILNIDRRLKQLYGTGLSIQSIKGEGTTVSFKIPRQQYIK